MSERPYHGATSHSLEVERLLQNDVTVYES